MQMYEPQHSGLLYGGKERVGGRKTCKTSRVLKDKREAKTKASGRKDVPQFWGTSALVVYISSDGNFKLQDGRCELDVLSNWKN
jgi:hypothetical protein